MIDKQNADFRRAVLSFSSRLIGDKDTTPPPSEVFEEYPPDAIVDAIQMLTLRNRAFTLGEAMKLAMLAGMTAHLHYTKEEVAELTVQLAIEGNLKTPTQPEEIGPVSSTVN